MRKNSIVVDRPPVIPEGMTDSKDVDVYPQYKLMKYKPMVQYKKLRI